MSQPFPSIADFARDVLNRPLYPYQQEVAEAIISSISGGHGKIFTVMMARQSGKNQLSAVIEAFLLNTMPQGTIVKAAPTARPQLLNSRFRLLSLLDSADLRERLWQSEGHVGLAPCADRSLVRAHAGPRVMFFSAGIESNVVGATADLLLEIDEAQDVSRDKFDRDFRPMASTTNATTVLYGTAWSEDTLLAQQRAVNLEREQLTGERLHFEFDWRTLAAINPAYCTFVEREIERLGEQHIAIQTQYLLRPISGANSFLNPLQRTLLQGEHRWQESRIEDGWYIAGMDVGGEERPVSASAVSPGSTQTSAGSMGSNRRDSSVITIGRVRYNHLNLPHVEVVHHEWWTGKPYLEQYAATLALVESWGIRSLIIDASGLGAGLASLLAARLGEDRVVTFTFTRPSKSRLAYQLLALINSGRLKLYTGQSAPAAIFNECWQQLHRARYRLPAPDVMDFYVDPAEGHDDFLMSLALLTEATNGLNMPAASAFIRPRRYYENESRF